MQGDSLSPFLFVICMNSLSRRLNERFPEITVQTRSGESFATNHLLFVENLKLLFHDQNTMIELLKTTKKFFAIIGLKINISKSATNTKGVKRGKF